MDKSPSFSLQERIQFRDAFEELGLVAPKMFTGDSAVQAAWSYFRSEGRDAAAVSDTVVSHLHLRGSRARIGIIDKINAQSGRMVVGFSNSFDILPLQGPLPAFYIFDQPCVLESTSTES